MMGTVLLILFAAILDKQGYDLGGSTAGGSQKGRRGVGKREKKKKKQCVHDAVSDFTCGAMIGGDCHLPFGCHKNTHTHALEKNFFLRLAFIGVYALYFR